MKRSDLVDMTVAMSREVVPEAYEREEREAVRAELRREGMSEAEVALIFGDAAHEREDAPVRRPRVMEPY